MKKITTSIEEQLTAAGFQTLEKRGEKILIASGAEDFCKSHAAFLQAADKHTSLIGCSRLDQLGGPVLIVHRREAAEIGDQSSEVSKGDMNVAPEAAL